MNVKINSYNQENWKEITVKSCLPESVKKLEELACNLWWTWDNETKDIFRTIDIDTWIEAGSNPVLMLNILPHSKLIELGENQEFVKRLDKAYDRFIQYMNAPKKTDKPSIAYFSMEYGLTEILKIYSGGLGVLAGDYLKEASDYGADMTAIGFLYRYGYFTQELSVEGQQIASYDAQNFNSLPLTQVKDENDEPVMIEVPFPGRTVYANLWRVCVGRVKLYLLDTDVELNSESDKSITYQLYGGDWENRLKQEVLLGIGGMLALKKLGIKKDVYHCNEGHAALINVQRLVDYVADGLSFQQALEVVRASSLYTVHTPVPAGHDSFTEDLFHRYMDQYPAQLGISWDDLIGLGRENPTHKDEKFSMSVFACNTCQEVNGVSKLHGIVSQKMFNPIWKGYFPEEMHVSYVTNGVHLPTWTGKEWKAVYQKHFDKNFYQDQSNLDIWKEVHNIPDSIIWETRMVMKRRLVDFIKAQFDETWLKNQGDPSRIVSVLNAINTDALIIGFGRRFATYKRAHLLFTDLERLEKIVNNPDRPVQFLFTGKAHPADGGGQGLIKQIIEISRMPQFLGKIIFLENYDMRLAKRLISGVDVWLNTPTRPLEASGTSGQKAQMNGVLNFSVLDGWWYEGYVKDAGWALTDKRTYENQEHQDQLDAATIYSILENEIIPLYYSRNGENRSTEWIKVIKKSIAEITPIFTTKRMMDDYFDKFYNKLAERSVKIQADNFAQAKEIAAWKNNVAIHWDNIEITKVQIPEELQHDPHVSKKYNLEVSIDTKDLNGEGIGIELVVLKKNKHNEDILHEVKEMNLASVDGSKMHFNLEYELNLAGTIKYAFRMFPKNEHLPHRQDFCYVRWF